MNKQIPAWALYLTIAIAVILLCGVSGAVAASKPEPEIRTVTEYKTKEVEVKDDSQTYEIAELKVQLETCQRSTLLSSQAMVDAVNAFIKVSEGAGELNVSKVEEATAIIQAIDATTVGNTARECDPTIASKITGLPE